MFLFEILVVLIKDIFNQNVCQSASKALQIIHSGDVNQN